MSSLLHSMFAPPRDVLLLLLSAWLGLLVADRRARQSAIGENAFDSLVLWMLAAYVLGGRASFLLEHFTSFAASPLSAFSLNRDAFDGFGALASALLAGAIAIQRRHLPAWETLDLLAPLLACLGIGVALSHLASGAAFGSEARLPWSIYQWGAWRHPAQAYELIIATAIFLLTWYRRGGMQGGRFLFWLGLTGAARLLLEGFRGDSALLPGGLRLAQLVSWLLLAAALIALDRRAGSESKTRGSS